MSAEILLVNQLEHQNQPGGACQLCSRHPEGCRYTNKACLRQALKALAREGGLRLCSRTLEGVGLDLHS